MAHMSTLEAAKTKMKNLRKARSKKRAEQAMISPEEKARLTQARFSKTLKEEVDIALYDYEHKQYPSVKYPLLRQLLKDRLHEIKEQKKQKPDLTDEYTKEEKELFIKERNLRLETEQLKLERIQEAIKEDAVQIQRYRKW